MEIPEISITRAVSSNIIGGVDATYTLTANIQPHKPLEIKYTPSNGPANNPGNFLNPMDPVSMMTKNTGVERLSEELTFAPTGNPPVITATLSVPTVDDRLNLFGDITVQLVDDTAPKDYTLTTDRNLSTSATANIIQIPSPELSIVDITTPITEGGMASFTVQTMTDPRRTLTVNYTKANTKGDFLGNPPEGMTEFPPESIDLDFRKPAVGAPFFLAQIPITTRIPDGKDADHGTVTVTLNNPSPTEPNAYTVKVSPDNAAKVTVQDLETPRISIANAPEALAGSDALFELTAHIEPWEALNIRFKPINTTGSFLDITGGSREGGESDEPRSQSLDFISEGVGKPFKATLEVATIDDPNATSGSMRVELLADNQNTPVSYILSTDNDDNDGTVAIVDVPNPTLSIADITTPVVEGATANFVVTATEDPKRTLSVNYVKANTTGKFFGDPPNNATEFPPESADLNFTRADSTSPWIATLPIQIPTDGEDSDHGSITITLQAPTTANDYTVAQDPDHDAVATVHDLETPEISIEDAPATFVGNQAMFKLTADIQPWEPIKIRFIPTKVGNFLGTTGEIQGQTYRISDLLTFSAAEDGDPITAILAIDVIDDSNLTEGSITIEIIIDNIKSPIAYKVSTTNAPQNSATVMVRNYPIPELSIADITTPVEEGGMANFVVTATENPFRTLSVNYTQANVSGKFLGDPPDDATEFPQDSADLEFTRADSTSPWTAILPIQTLTDMKDTDHGEISVTLDVAEFEGFYTVDPMPDRDVGKVTIHDKEIPEISFYNASTAYNTFSSEDSIEITLESDIQPWQAVEVRFNPVNTTGNFLDDEDDTDPLTGYTSGDTYSESVAFTLDEMTDEYLGTLSIPIKADPNNDNGRISISLFVDDSTLKDYKLTENIPDSRVTINVYDFPLLYFTGTQTDATEGGTANFVVTSNIDPRDPVDIMYKVSEVSTEKNTGYLHSSETPDTSTPIRLTFTQADPSNPSSPWTAKIPIDLRNADGKDATHGAIKVVLDQAAGNARYKVPTPPISQGSPSDEATIRILDKEVPEITIANADDTFAGDDAEFTVTSDIEPWDDLSIVVKPKNTTGSFLDTTLGPNDSNRTITNIAFTESDEGGTFIGTLEIPTIEDRTRASGTLTVVLVDDTAPKDYTIVEADKTATVTVYNKPKLTISAPTTTVTEGETLEYTVTSDFNPRNTLAVKYKVSETTPNYLHSSVTTNATIENPLSTDLTLTQADSSDLTSPWTAKIPIQLRTTDGIDADHGAITVEMFKPEPIANFDVDISSDTHKATAIIYDAEIPEITIENAVNIFAGSEAEFELTSDIQPWQNLSIKVTPTNSTGNFLKTSELDSDLSLIEDLTFASPGSGQAIVSTLPIPTQIDNTMASGTISVVLVDDTAPKDYAIVEADKTASVTVYNKPTLSIDLPSSDVTEGGELKYIVTADFNPRNPLITSALSVDYTVTETSSYRHASVTTNTTLTADLNFQQISPSTDWTAELPIQLRAVDGIDAAHGAIKVQLDAPDASDNYLVAASPDDEATATIYDAEIPVITIADAIPTFAGENAEFTLESDIQPLPNLSIKFTPTETSGNFLNVTSEASGSPRTEDNVSFTRSASDQPYTYTLLVPTVADPVANSGTISVVLIDDATPKDYTIDPENKTASVTVYKITTLSIAPPNAEGEVNEGDDLHFIVTADFNPRTDTTPLTIAYTPAESPERYFNGPGTNNISDTIDLTFRQVPPSTNWTARIPINLKAADGSIGGNSTITVTLDSPANNAGYLVAEPNKNSAEVLIIDADVPRISIADAIPTFAGESAIFKITSQIEIDQSEAITITYKPKNVTGNFLDENPDGTTKPSDMERTIDHVTFTRSQNDQPFTYDLSIDTTADDSLNSGTFSVELIADDSDPKSYTIDPDNNKASVTVYKITTLSIAPVATEVDEGGDLSFIVSSDFDPQTTPQNQLTVAYTPMETTTNYLHSSITSGTSIPIPLNFQQVSPSTNWTARITIPLRTRDQIDAINGSISVTLDDPAANAGYLVADSPDNQATVSILDLDVPEFSIANAIETFASTDSEFIITSNIATTQSHTLMVKPKTVAGSFLDVTAGASDMTRSIENVSFTQSASDQPYTYTLSIPTVADDNLPSGSFSVLLESNSTLNTYDVDENNKTATVTVYKVSTLSLSTSKTQANEGEELVFIVTADFDPRPIEDPLTIAYTPTIANTDFLPSTLTSGDSTSIDLIFTQVSPSTDWTARIPIQLKAVDNIDTPDGSIKVALDTPAVDAGYAITTEAGTGLTVSILDTDIPSFSIDDAEVTYHGEYAEFTITSSIATTQLHTLIVNPTNTDRDFLDPNDGGASGMNREIENVRFTQSAPNQPFTYILRIKTKTDTTHTVTDIITVELKENSQAGTYEVTPNENTASVIVYRLSTLAISPPNSSVSEGGTLEFIVTANYDPRTSTTPLNVGFTPSVENGNFLDENITIDMPTSEDLIFTRASPVDDWTAKLPVSLRPKDDIDAVNGSVTVTLNQADINPAYLVAADPNNNATATILDVDVPTITIADATAVFAGTDAQFTLTSSIQSTRTHAIMIKPINSTGNFLDETAGTSGTPRPINNVSFSTIGQPFTYTLAVPTKIDPTIATGEITVELVADSDPKAYEINANPNAPEKLSNRDSKQSNHTLNFST